MNTDADWCSPPESVFICVYHLLSVFFTLKNKRVDLIVSKLDPGSPAASGGANNIN